ncbi:uncharacterized protein LOC135945516 [Cloeon dipterum]|uniref:uncharacterized protein LOC135945516 n=1 Tax=Cloeon dipterum TaxID=197152 RepID=UPI00321FD33D
MEFKMCVADIISLIILLTIFQSAADEINLATLDHLFKMGEQASGLSGKDEIVMFVGATGVGKSTLSKFVRKDDSLTIQENDQFDCIFTDNEHRVGSNDSMTSKTLYPNVDLDNETNILLVDMPGFQDTRSPEFDLVSTFFSKKIVDNVKRLKVVVVENYANLLLNNQRSAFTTAIKNTASLLKGNVAAFRASVGLIVTKVDTRRNDVHVVNSVRVFLQRTREHFRSRNDSRDESELVDSILQGELIAIFRRPEEVGDPWELETLKKNYVELRQLIFEKLEFSAPLKKLHFSLVPETKTFVKDKRILQNTLARVNRGLNLILQRVGASFRSAVNDDFRPDEAFVNEAMNYSSKVQLAVDQMDTPAKLDSLCRALHVSVRQTFWADLEITMQQIAFFDEVLDKNDSSAESMLAKWKEQFRDEVRSVRSILSLYSSLVSDFDSYPIHTADAAAKLHKLALSFSRFKSQLKTLGFSNKTVRAASSVLTDDSSTQLKWSLQKFIATFAENNSTFREYRNIGTFEGRYITLSRIAQRMELSRDLNTFCVVATRKIFIDCDLHLEDVHLVLIAPVVQVIGDRSIRLTGSDGAPHSAAKASNATFFWSREQGRAGAAGNPGFRSGDFHLLAVEVENAHLLRVSSRGGGGGQGQTGGDGWSTPPRPFPSELKFGGSLRTLNGQCGMARLHYAEVRLQEVKEWVESLPLLLYNQFDAYKTVYITVYNRANESATNGGDGGAAGAAALPGEVVLNVARAHTARNAKLIRENGAQGAVGAGGRPGSNAGSCSYRLYECEWHRGAKWILFMSVREQENMYYCWSNSTGYCASLLPEAYPGRQGNQTELQSSQYKNGPLQLGAALQAACLRMAAFAEARQLLQHVLSTHFFHYGDALNRAIQTEETLLKARFAFQIL